MGDRDTPDAARAAVKRRTEERDRERAIEVPNTKDPADSSMYNSIDGGARLFCLPRVGGRRFKAREDLKFREFE